jgi:beta-lactamase class A
MMLSKSINRRSLAAIALGGLCTSKLLASGPSVITAPADTANGLDASELLKAIEAQNGGRLGVFAVNTGSGSSIAYRADERFPMCSTHKMLVGAAILSGVEEGRFRLDQRVGYGPTDILDYAPVAKANLAAGFMTIEALCEAAVRLSDNTADNLLLQLLDGPSGWTRYSHSIGDHLSRLDRYEPHLNSAIPGDPRDTSTPRAMNGALAAVMFGNVLEDVSRAHLKRWMLDSEITTKLLRAGLPAGWSVADKSGSGSNGTRNDVGILFPPRAAPIVVSVFYTQSPAGASERDNVIANCARIVARHLN